jgi:hypothetical protein
MLYSVLIVVVNMLGGVAAAAVLGFGFAFLIFLGDAEAGERPLVSRRFDRLAVLVIYLSWFGAAWWFGLSAPFVIVACAATTLLCLTYAASYEAARRRSGPRSA